MTDNPKLLTREEAAQRARDVHGVKLSSATLATLASRGGGPGYLRFGRRALYEPAAFDGWIESRLERRGDAA